MKWLLSGLLISAALVLSLPRPRSHRGSTEDTLPVEIRGPRPLADFAARMQSAAGRVVTYEEDAPPAASRRSLRLTSIPGWPEPLFSRQTLESAAAASERKYQVEESSLGLHLVPADRPALLDTRISVPPLRRTFLRTVAEICREVARIRRVRLDAEWAGELLNIGPEELYKGSMEPYLVWSVTDMRARDALVKLLAESRTTFSWVQRCREDLFGGGTACILDITLPRRWNRANTPARLDVFLYDRCRNRPPFGALLHPELPDRRPECMLAAPPPPPPPNPKTGMNDGR